MIIDRIAQPTEGYENRNAFKTIGYHCEKCGTGFVRVFMLRDEKAEEEVSNLKCEVCGWRRIN